MSPDEAQILRRLHYEEGHSPAAIAKLLGRHKSSVCRALKAKKGKKPVGKPRALTSDKVDQIEAKLKDLIMKADGRYEVTLAMLKRSARVSCSSRTIQRALHERGIRFRAMRSKPRLTADDIKERFAFAKKYRGKSKAWWCQTLHMAIDLKSFPVYIDAKGRDHAARREVRGAYRKTGDGLAQGYVKPSKALRYNTGAQHVLIAAGFGLGKVRVWEDMGNKWSGEAASNLYAGPLLRALKRASPSKKRFLILEDNDPTGFKSQKGRGAKTECKINVLAIPPRSPDLNPCDYALWSRRYNLVGDVMYICMCRSKQRSKNCTRVNQEMRAHEEKWSKRKRETRNDYIARLRQTAMGLQHG